MTILNSFSYEDIGFLLALVAVLLLLIWNIRLEHKLGRIFANGKTKNLDETLAYLKSRTDEYEEFREDLEKYLALVESRLRRSVQGVGTVRFNPFKGNGAGGNQSFATAFVNEHGNGLIISTLHARDHMSVFAKPLKKFESEFELTGEEKDAITRAKADIA